MSLFIVEDVNVFCVVKFIEVDEMFNMGFVEDVEMILVGIFEDKQLVLFSVIILF